jgi:hypothetical protein
VVLAVVALSWDMLVSCSLAVFCKDNTERRVASSYIQKKCIE